MILRNDTVLYHPIEGARTFPAGNDDPGAAWSREPWDGKPFRLTHITDDGSVRVVERTAPSVEIPGNWDKLPWFSLKALAKNFSSHVEGKEHALALIEAELKRRG